MGQENSPRVIAMLKEAVALQQQGRLDDARRHYERVLALAPSQFDALHLLGVVHRQQGDPARALELIEAALRLDPAQAGAHCNLGAALQDLGRTGEALASYETALRLAPGYALAFANHGNALRKLGRLPDAVDSYERALVLRPGYPEAACNRAIALLGLDRPEAALASADLALASRPRYPEALCVRANALFALRRFEEALAGYVAAIALDARGAEAHAGRGLALQKLGRHDEALGAFDAALARRPGHWPHLRQRADALLAVGRGADAIAAYQEAQAAALALGAESGAGEIGFELAALGVGDVPVRAPQAYVKALFDGYAGHFDRHLTEVLRYRTPGLLGAALARQVDATGLDSLDLGCGTGLCGPILRPFSRTLVGVDLSERMLARAAQTGLYDSLACADLQAYLANREGDVDLVMAADVLVYFGDLGGLFAQVHAALRPGGWFAFSTEKLAEEPGGGGYALQPSNRYAHARGYLERLAAGNGFAIAEAFEEAVRSEHGRGVVGHLVVLRRAA